ncbi:Calcium-dependent lipid-binding (CaLB domain) plant phosphoribosyltransferase family protein [Striga hermonthica]|uniref:Calcium-dependent lipid-binding (CaLB domain) plant phosphoribosyltransferase family protein n=1 Tax=Striga hermonthica TaxID=68872 RepID=A0A9N7MG13_STRHE|nr:Calcium-dependent lipid-binding (CaLB domain) plant phosphoribosyltransferase family protein [Striga hermonthica]
MADKPPQIAILGAGIFVRSTYIPRLAELSGLFVLRAIWSRTQESARGAAEIAKKFFQDVECKWGEEGLDEIIRDASITGVVVALAGQTQVDMSLRLLKGGKHVLQAGSELEKAISGYNSLKPAPIWAVAENYRFEPAFVEGRKRMSEIGDIINIHVIIEGSMNSSNPYYSTSWRHSLTLAGCEITSVSAVTSHIDSTLPPPDHISSTIQLENGSSGVFVMVVSSKSPKILWRVVGLKGTLQVERGSKDGKHGYTVVHFTADGQSKSWFYPFSGVTEELKAFLSDISPATIKNDGSFQVEPRLAFLEGARDVAVLAAMLESGEKQGVPVQDLPARDVRGSCSPYVEVRLGNYRGITKHFEKRHDPEWNLVFAFPHNQLQASFFEIVVKDKDLVLDDFLGRVTFDLADVPRRVPPDSELAPQWYKLEDKKGGCLKKGEVMVAVWRGTQADEAFANAWHSDAAAVGGDAVSKIRGKVYISPRLWYLRVNVIQCQDLIPGDKNRAPEACVRVVLGNQVLRTKVSSVKSVNPFWNEDLVFVAAEPFEEPLVVAVEDRVAPGKDEALGQCMLPLAAVARRLDDKPVPARWHNLEKHAGPESQNRKETKFSSKILLRVSLDGGYHVLDESTHYSSDYRPSSRMLWKSSIGVLELGIISAAGLSPMKIKEGRGTTDAFCVAKYGPKWVRTRTVIDSGYPRWNEQYTWEVHDPCTVVTVGVYDNGYLQGGKDSCVGKVRIRLSTLETDRVYTHSYPLVVLTPSGVKKRGEIQLAVRCSCISYLNMLHKYGQPLLPKMHYSHPLSVAQLESLRYHAIQIVSSRLGRAEPQLKKEVVESMLDFGSHMWSVRKARANFLRITSVLGGAHAAARWFNHICRWRNPAATVLVHVLLVILVIFPELVFPTFFLYLGFVGIWNYRWRSRHPPHVDVRLSGADSVGPDELDEELDTFPTSRSGDVVRMRYDRLRSVGGRVQAVAGDMATQGERVGSLLSWRDPRASALFVVFCFLAAVVTYVTPGRLVVLALGFYVLRHPKLRSKVPWSGANFFRRLPAMTDLML